VVEGDWRETGVASSRKKIRGHKFGEPRESKCIACEGKAVEDPDFCRYTVGNGWPREKKIKGAGHQKKTASP